MQLTDSYVKTWLRKKEYKRKISLNLINLLAQKTYTYINI